MVANATGIPQENTVWHMKYRFFEHSDDSGRTFSDYLRIALTSSDLCITGICGIPQYQKDPTQEIERNFR